MSTMTETSLPCMKTRFPQTPEPIQGIPALQSLFNLLFHLCRCTQMQRSPVSATMNLLFYAAPPDMYAFLTAEAHPATVAPFPPIVLDVPNYRGCTNNNKHNTVKATHTIDKKAQTDNITMNTTLPKVFLEALSLQVRASFLQRRLCKPNIVFVDMFMWLVNHYGKTTAEGCKAKHHQMAAKWHPANGFDTLISSPARRLQDAPTSRWPTTTSLPSASALSSSVACMPGIARLGLHARPSIQELLKLLTP
jgi:hypothetical protein